MGLIEPHSFVDSQHPLTNHVNLCLYFDFSSKTIDGSVMLTLEKSYTGDLFLDTRSLEIHGAYDSKSKPIPFVLGTPEPIKGTLLRVSLSDQSCFSVTFKTHQSASALQWLTPTQTVGKKLPYVYTQCQCINARSIFPCQDTPKARIRYSALLNIPAEMSAVMSAAHVGRNVPLFDEAKGACSDEKWVMHGRVVEHFCMQQSIAPYLFAFAVGNIVSKEVGPRTKVYSEPSPILEVAALEFMKTEEIIKQGERLFGGYEWERFDVLILPPSFMNGGMENPRMVFLTPTVIGADLSSGVLAHELAHTWTGNLITNANNNHFWLNEGLTTYAERRITEALEGKERAALAIELGWCEWRNAVELFKDKKQFTKLRTNQEGFDPEDVYSEIPYEKGFQFIWRLERQVGRPVFDEFLIKYIQKFKFQSIDTDTFLVFLKQNLPSIEKEVDLDVWIDGTGIPPDVIEPISTIHNKVLAMSRDFTTMGKMPSEEEVSGWQGLEWTLYLDYLPKNLEAPQIATLDKQFRFSESSNWEVKVGFLSIAAFSGYKPCFKMIERTLHEVGRLRFLRRLYTCLLQSEEGKKLAKRVYGEARDSYHPIAQGVLQNIFSKFT